MIDWMKSNSVHGALHKKDKDRPSLTSLMFQTADCWLGVYGAFFLERDINLCCTMSVTVNHYMSYLRNRYREIFNYACCDCNFEIEEKETLTLV